MNINQLELLFSRQEHTVPSVLSVYLDLDESKEINLNRGFERRFKEMTSSIENAITDIAERERFVLAATRMSDFISVYEVHAHSIAMFIDATDGFFWHEELNIPMESQARWDSGLFLQPLIAALDEFEKYGIVLLDQANMRLFRMLLGDIEEVAHKNFSRKAVQRLRSVGMDHLRSASHAQQKADEKVRTHLRRMITEISALVQSERVEHLVLAGSSETTAELFDLLPKRLALLVTGRIELSFEASADDVFRAVSRLAATHERDGESMTVRNVLTAAAKNGKAVAGIGQTLSAVNHSRIWQLIYSAGFRLRGFECVKCLSLVTRERDACVYCGGELRRVPDVIEHAVEHAIRQGARLEVVRGDAAEALASKGGIAAFLKTRTASVRV